MKNSNEKSASETVCGIDSSEVASENSATRDVRDVLSQILREGAQKMLQSDIQKEVDEYLQNRSGIVGEDGRRLVIRNGSLPERELVTGVGAIQLRQPRVCDKRLPEEREVFSIFDAAEVSSQNKIYGGTGAMVVPQRHQHERLSESSSSIAQSGREWIFTDHDYSTEVRLGRRVRRIVKTVFEGQAICLHVGGWHSQQHSIQRQRRSPLLKTVISSKC